MHMTTPEKQTSVWVERWSRTCWQQPLRSGEPHFKVQPRHPWINVTDGYFLISSLVSMYRVSHLSLSFSLLSELPIRNVSCFPPGKFCSKDKGQLFKWGKQRIFWDGFGQPLQSPLYSSVTCICHWSHIGILTTLHCSGLHAFACVVVLLLIQLQSSTTPLSVTPIYL